MGAVTWLKNYLKPFLNWRFALCFLTAWAITNGWCYIFIGLGLLFEFQWALNIGLGYLAFLWLPFTPEKIITIPIALILHKWWFRHDEKSKKMLIEMKEQAKRDWRKIKNLFRRKNGKEKN